MWSYYGCKNQLVNKGLYPKPKYDKIIEPFCGAAFYALKYWQKDVLLVDKFEDIIEIWNYLISATMNDILSLPDVNYQDDLRNFKQLSDAERKLIGYYINPGSNKSKNVVQRWSSWNKKKKWVSEQLHKIRHWKTRCCSYDEIENEEVTWMVDPPYSGSGGKHYIHNNEQIDYDYLRDWCLSRKGEIIVCENSEHNGWLPFQPLSELKGQRHKTTEVIYYRDNSG